MNGIVPLINWSIGRVVSAAYGDAWELMSHPAPQGGSVLIISPVSQHAMRPRDQTNWPVFLIGSSGGHSAVCMMPQNGQPVPVFGFADLPACEAICQ